MNRQLTCDLKPDDTSFLLADELVHYGFINAVSDHQGQGVGMLQFQHFSALHFFNSGYIFSTIVQTWRYDLVKIHVVYCFGDLF